MVHITFLTRFSLFLLLLLSLFVLFPKLFRIFSSILSIFFFLVSPSVKSITTAATDEKLTVQERARRWAFSQFHELVSLCQVLRFWNISQQILRPPLLTHPTHRRRVYLHAHPPRPHRKFQNHTPNFSC